MTEEWRDVVGFEGVYRVSSLGRVASTPRSGTSGGILKPNTATKYPAVTLRTSGSRTLRTVHSLVAEAFLGPRPRGFDIRHLDGIVTDSAATNLAYGTRTENALDRVAHGHDRNAGKTHCKFGHEFTVANTYRLPSYPGGRYCRACKADREARRRARLAA